MKVFKIILITIFTFSSFSQGISEGTAKDPCEVVEGTSGVGQKVSQPVVADEDQEESETGQQ